MPICSGVHSEARIFRRMKVTLLRGTKVKRWIFLSAPVSVFRVGSLMRALFAYFFAISLLLWGGYECLHWLFEPPRPISQRPVARENLGAEGKNVASNPPSVTAGTPPQTGFKVSHKIETIESSDPPAS